MPLGKIESAKGDSSSALQLPFASDSSKDNFKHNCCVDRLRISKDAHWADQLAAFNKRVFPVIFVGIALEYRVGGEIELCHECLVTGSGNFVVDVLSYAAGVMAGHVGFEVILTSSPGGKRAAIVEALVVIVSGWIGLPHLQLGIRQSFSVRIEYRAGYRQRQARIVGSAEPMCERRLGLVKGTQIVGRRRLQPAAFSLFPHGEQ